MCCENLSDEHMEGDAPYGMLGSGSLEDDITNDCKEVNLGPLENVVNEVGHLKGEIILVGHRNEVVGVYTPKKLDCELVGLVGDICAPTNVLYTKTDSQI